MGPRFSSPFAGPLRFATTLTPNAVGRVTPRLLEGAIRVKLRSGPLPLPMVPLSSSLRGRARHPIVPGRPSLRPTPMPQGWPGLSFVANGGRRSTAPHPPPCSYRSTRPLRRHPPFGLERNHLFSLYAPAHLGTIMSSSLGRAPPSSPSEERRPGFSLFVPVL